MTIYCPNTMISPEMVGYEQTQLLSLSTELSNQTQVSTLVL